MARTDPAPSAPVTRQGEPAAVSPILAALFYLVCAGVGAGLLTLVGFHFGSLAAGLALGSDAVPELLALHGPRTQTVGAAAAAADSLSQLVELAALVCAMGAALLLLLGAALSLTPQRRRSAHRIATTGLWMALGVSLAAMLPVDGFPLAVQQGVAGGPAEIHWHLGWKVLALASGAGLLLSAITAPHRRIPPMRRRGVPHT